MHIRVLLGALAGLALIACDESRPSPPLGPEATIMADRRGGDDRDDDDDGELSVEGSGRYYIDVDDLVVTFSYEAEQEDDERAEGNFRIRAREADGLIIDVAGKVTCMAVDAVNHRAWIGGVVTRNRSTDPGLLTDIHEKGDDVWFRVVDMGRGPTAVDRTSFFGFRGAAGLLTSADYCAARIWPDDNARTWPVIKGGIQVRP